MKKEAKKSGLLTLVLVVVFAVVVIVVVYSILNKPTRPVFDPDEYRGENGDADPTGQSGDDDAGDVEEENYTFGTTAEGEYLFPPDEYTLMDGPAVTLTHRIAGGYDIWEGTDPDGEKIMLAYNKTEFQYVRGSTQSGVGDFHGFDTWAGTGETVMRVFDKWRDGLVAVPASVSEDGETMTLHVPDIWRAGNGR